LLVILLVRVLVLGKLPSEKSTSRGRRLFTTYDRGGQCRNDDEARNIQQKRKQPTGSEYL
jgi:hypothetical protein